MLIGLTKGNVHFYHVKLGWVSHSPKSTWVHEAQVESFWLWAFWTSRFLGECFKVILKWLCTLRNPYLQLGYSPSLNKHCLIRPEILAFFFFLYICLMLTNVLFRLKLCSRYTNAEYLSEISSVHYFISMASGNFLMSSFPVSQIVAHRSISIMEFEYWIHPLKWP